MGEALFIGHTGLAYIGPGAGFAFLGSFLILFLALSLALVSVLLLPLRFLLTLLRRRGVGARGPVNRVIVVGMDGLAPARVRKLIDEGEMPNFKRLADKGTFCELESTCPPISPVAWSSFATGVNPGKHGIFDFLNRDLRTYTPELSSCRVGKKDVVLLRHSKPFWKILGDHGVFSTILRVPVTFPPEPFRGLLVSGMCVPDLRGTQGTYTLYEEGCEETLGATGVRIPLTFRPDGRASTYLPGPPSAKGSGTLRLHVKIRVDRDNAGAVVKLGGESIRLKQGEYSEWVQVKFRQGLRTIHGICRILLVSVKPAFKLYVTPLNIDPEHPAMPLSHPPYYAIHLAKLHGPFSTLGLAEDTSALNEGVIDDAAFLRQAWDIQREREVAFFEALKRTRRGVCAIVFDLPDRVQHMFYRYDRATKSVDMPGAGAGSVRAIDDVYRGMDVLLGRVLDEAGPDTAVIVLSDHGFTDFRRAVNLNAWLEQEGYLARKKGAAGAAYLEDVDWERTKAYSFGLSGIYLNVRGREGRGIVGLDEKARTKDEISAKLSTLRDPVTNLPAIRTVYDSGKIYSGPYSDSGPDLVVGYESGYRASWETAKGSLGGEVFHDNLNPWSGDHCIDRSIVPGVLLCNLKLDVQGKRPAIIDIAPTVLAFFGIKRPGHMDGHAIGLANRGAE